MGGDRTGDAAQAGEPRRSRLGAGQPPQIQLGDLLLAIDALAPADAETEAAIAAALGLVASTPGRDEDVAPDGPGDGPSGDGPACDADSDEADSAAGRTVRPVLDDQGLVTTLTAVEGRTRPAPAWLASMPALAPPAAGEGEEGLSLAPLLTPRWARGILTVALATRRQDDGPLDVERAVEQAASGRAVQELPRLPWPTNRYGAQVLLDLGQGMLPFRGDQSQLQAAVVRLVGADRVTVLRFAGCPSRGAGVGARTAWGPWEPPRRGRPVVVVSDLGVAATGAPDAATTDEWLEFAADVRRAGCPLAAFVPYPAARVSPALRRAFAVFPWDRSTSVRLGRQVAGRATARP